MNSVRSYCFAITVLLLPVTGAAAQLPTAEGRTARAQSQSEQFTCAAAAAPSSGLASSRRWWTRSIILSLLLGLQRIPS